MKSSLEKKLQLSNQGLQVQQAFACILSFFDQHISYLHCACKIYNDVDACIHDSHAWLKK